MVIVTIDDQAVIHNGDTFAEDVQNFQAMCRSYKAMMDELNAKKDPDIKAYTHRSQDSMVCRYMIRGVEKTIIVAFVPSGAILSLDWKQEDKVLVNAQGGETHIKGWYLE